MSVECPAFHSTTDKLAKKNTLSHSLTIQKEEISKCCIFKRYSETYYITYQRCLKTRS